MKVLYLVSTLRSCGPTNQLFYIIKNLDPDKFQPSVLTLSPEPDNSEWDKFQAAKIPVNSLKLSRWQGILFAGSRLKQFVKQYAPQVIHSQGIRPDTLSAKCLSGYKRVATIRNYPFDDYPMKFGKLIGNYSAQRHLRAWQKIDFPVSCSQTINQLITELGVKSQTVRNGVDGDLYRPVNVAEKTQLKQRLNLPLDAKIIVSAGTLIPRKQPEMLIKGFLKSQLSKDSILLLLGDGRLRQECQNLAEGSSNIRILGEINNVVDYLQVADCFVSASLSEGLPNAAMEALACGVPVCLSDIKPHREISDLDPNVGVLFPVQDPDALATQLDNLVAARSENNAIAARSLIDNQLNAVRMSRNYQQIYLS